MFDETLRNLRESKHLSQKQLAEALYISPSTISQYESGKIKPSHDNLERLAHSSMLASTIFTAHPLLQTWKTV